MSPSPLRRLLGYLGPYRWTVAVAIGFTVFVSLARLSQARFIGTIFGLMSESSFQAARSGLSIETPLGPLPPVQALTYVCLLFLVVMALMGMASYCMRYLIQRAGQSATRDLRESLFRHIQQMPLSFFDGMRQGEVQSRASGDVQVAGQAFTQLADAGRDFLIVVIALSFMVYKDWKMTMAVLLLSPLVGVAIGRFGSAVKGLSRSIQARVADLSSITYESVSGIRGIKSYGLEAAQMERYDEQSAENFRLNMQMVRYTASQSPVIDFLSAMGIMVIVWLGAWRILQGQASLGQMAEYWTLLVMTTQPITALSVFYTNLQTSAAAGSRIFEILDQPTEVDLHKGLPDLPPIQGKVEFDQVTFGYRPDKPALRGMNLTVEAGEVVAIVGSNGAGKSTLIQLLGRFYDPQQGCVRIDGVNLSSVNAASLRRQLGVVSQESTLLAGTIAENIGRGKPGATPEEIEAAARLANADEFVGRLPDGYQTQVGEHGSKLSGGQRQRVAIARALLRDPRILILDEFTSGIDPESELLISEAIDNSLKGRTCLVIAHRFNTIRNADRIIVLHEGEIVESGNHDQLMQADGLYRRIFLAQLQSKGQVSATTAKN